MFTIWEKRTFAEICRQISPCFLSYPIKMYFCAEKQNNYGNREY